jgi:hypothetical protein
MGEALQGVLTILSSSHLKIQKPARRVETQRHLGGSMKIHMFVIATMLLALTQAQAGAINEELGTPRIAEARSFRFISLDPRIALKDFSIRIRQSCQREFFGLPVQCLGNIKRSTVHNLKLNLDGSVNVPAIHAIKDSIADMSDYSLSVELVANRNPQSVFVGLGFRGNEIAEDYRDFAGDVNMLLLSGASFTIKLAGTPLTSGHPLLNKKRTSLGIKLEMPMDFMSDFNFNKTKFDMFTQSTARRLFKRATLATTVVAFVGDVADAQLKLSGHFYVYNKENELEKSYSGELSIPVSSDGLQGVGSFDLQKD